MKEIAAKSILITGASGFIGSFVVEEALQRGMKVWAAVRKKSRRDYLKDTRINFIELDYEQPEQLARQLKTHKSRHGAPDYVVHCAGVTKCSNKDDFERVNYGHTRRLAETLQQLDMTPRQFVFVSTLSVMGPLREDSYTPINEADTPNPNTAYGRSKLKAEQYLKSIEGFPYVVMRPTGVYGPREKDYFLMAKSIKTHVETAVGFRRQDLTFVYVKDVVQAIFRAIERGVTRRSYFLTDGQVYAARDFAELIRKELGVHGVLRITLPLWMLKAVSLCAERVAAWRGRSSTLNSDKYRIMKQRNWQCDITPACNELGYRPEYDLQRGVAETIAWYKENEWL